MNQFAHQPWLLIVISACFGSTGSILMKKSRLVAVNSSFLASLFSPWFLAALLVYSTGLLLFAKALDRLPISIAVPFSTGVGFILTTLLSYYLLGERLAAHQLAAVSLIFAGSIMITR
jgi:multidrug transporter EmrE-like cation transporter